MAVSFLLLQVPFLLLGQGQGYNWVFGNRVGMTFYYGAPQVLGTSQMVAPAGCASISTRFGDLLFYTNGERVWNAQDRLMANGTGLAGNPLATQAAIIVPAPGNTDRFYIFTVDALGGPAGLQYSVVDMSLNGGLGDVVQKNIPLYGAVTEKLTAVRHANTQDVWLLAHEWQSDVFLAFEITPAGVNTTPVTTAIGTPHGGTPRNARGYMKLAPDGRTIGVCLPHSFTVELITFDPASGTLSNVLTIGGAERPYGIDFSPDGTKMYVSSEKDVALSRTNEIYQYDLTLPNPGAIYNLRQLVGSFNDALFGPDNRIGALQLAPDGKIYVARDNFPALGVINEPNVAGPACDYQVGGFPLFGKYSGLGLPSFVQSFLLPPMADFSLPRTICAGLPATFQGRTNEDTTRVAVTWRWDFGDPASGSANTSTAGARVSHIYATGGTYPVRLIVEFNGMADTMIKNLTVLPRPVAPAWADTVLCQGEVLVLDAGNPGAAFTWSTGFSSQRINVFRSGQYDVRVAFGDCNETYSIRAEFVPEPKLDLGPDTLLCAANAYTLDATPTNTTFAGYRYRWSTGDTTPTLTLRQSGTYRVTVGLGSCTQTAQVRVRLTPGPLPDLGPDTAFCAIEGRPLLDAGPGRSYLWWPSGLTTRTLQVDTPGIYAVRVIDAEGCQATDTVTLADNCLRVFLPSAFSPNADGLNDAFTWAFTQVESPVLRIYDRWGGLVFESQNPSGSWDGSHRQTGQAVPGGVYVYLLEGQYIRPDNRREPFARSGSLMILR